MTVPVEEVFNYGQLPHEGHCRMVGGRKRDWRNMYYEPCGVQAIVPSEVHPSKLRGVW
jgi:hypothetical protein